MEPAPQRLARIRGVLDAEEPGARGIEHVARNPSCQRLRALTMAGLTPATAVTKIFRDRLVEGMSQFAMRAGENFEKNLVESGAAKLLDLYRRAGRLSPTECKVYNVAEAAPIFNLRDKEQVRYALLKREADTFRLLRRKTGGDPGAPNIIIKPRVPVMLVGVEHYIEPDALVATDDAPFYLPVEIKDYSDREGKTDPGDIRSACRQAAVAVVALRQAVVRIGTPGIASSLESCDLILRVPGSYAANLRPMKIVGEIESLERMIDEAPRDLDALDDLLASIAPRATLSDAAVLDSIPNNYMPTCKEFCALAGRCKQQAVAAGNPVLLGNQAREVLSPAGSIRRALELLRNNGIPAASRGQAILQEDLREAEEVLTEALDYGT